MSSAGIIVLIIFAALVFSVALVILLIRYAFRKDAQQLAKVNQTIRKGKPDADVVGYNALFGK